jgi:hypothetical protein
MIINILKIEYKLILIKEMKINILLLLTTIFKLFSNFYSIYCLINITVIIIKIQK